jgi:hypothetical protein
MLQSGIIADMMARMHGRDMSSMTGTAFPLRRALKRRDER